MFAIAAAMGSNHPQLLEVAAPRQPAAGEVLCRTLELGVCGTDREIVRSARPWTPAGEDRLILGHECLARVETIGDGVMAFKPGDFVVPIVRRSAASPPCFVHRRVDLLPFGAFVERGIVWEHGFSQPLWLDRPEHLFAVPAEIIDLAVLTEPLAVSEKGVNEAALLTRARLGEEAWSGDAPPRVLVTGMGPIGFTAVLASLARGWPVTMLGRDEPTSFRAELVRRLGAAYQSFEDPPLASGDIEERGYDLLLECTGSDAVMIDTALQVRSCGVIVWLGSTRVPQPAMRNVERLIREGLLRNHLHVGCVNAAPRDFHHALRDLAILSADRQDELSALITARVEPSRSLWHYEHREAQGIKTVVVYED